MKLFLNALIALGLTVLVIVILGIDAGQASTMSIILAVLSAFIVSWWFEVAFERWPWLRVESDEQRWAKQQAAMASKKARDLERASARATLRSDDSPWYRAGQIARHGWLSLSSRALHRRVEK